MWNSIRSIIVLCLFLPLLIVAQDGPVKQKFVKEKHLHFKVGCNANFLNTNLYKSLNESEHHVFTPNLSICYNPSAEIEFENHFSRYVGVTVGMGFMQTRQYYHYTFYPPPNYYSSKPYVKEQDGLILSNIPHFNLSPSFYIKNTKVYVGIGVYKYYYSFKPISLGTFNWNLNNEGMAVYSNIGVTQSFEVKARRFTVTANYFGLTKSYDSGLQLSVGIAL